MKKENFQKPSLQYKIEEALMYRFGGKTYKKFLEKIDLKGEEKVIEFGSGGGALTKHLIEKIPKGKVICIENSDYFLKKAKKRLKKYKNIEFKKTISSLKKNYYEVIILHFALHDVEEKQREKIIKELAGRLKKRNYLYIKEPTNSSHGISSEKIEELMKKAKLKKIFSRQKKFLDPKNYFGVFSK
jgi:trans-aconitate methyltransferase